jgi:hypothetical protein
MDSNPNQIMNTFPLFKPCVVLSTCSSCDRLISRPSVLPFALNFSFSDVESKYEFEPTVENTPQYLKMNNTKRAQYLNAFYAFGY